MIPHSAPSWPRDVFVLVPAYHAKPELTRFLPELTAVVPAPQVVVVDDGSRDGTAKVCASCQVHCISHGWNRGKGVALRTGFDYLHTSCAQWVVTLDADGQHALADIPRFLAARTHYPDTGIFIGTRNRSPGAMPFARILSNTITSRLLSVATGQRIEDSQCGYRMYSTALTKQVYCRFPRFEMESEIILRACRGGFSVRFIPVQTLYFKGSTSHIAHVRDTVRWIRAIIATMWDLWQEHSSSRPSRHR